MKRLLPLCLAAIPGLAMADIPGMTQWSPPDGWTLLFWVLVYFTPTLVALWRNTNMILLVILVNTFLAWTAIGWVVALIMALKGEPNTWRPKKIKARKR